MDFPKKHAQNGDRQDGSLGGGRCGSPGDGEASGLAPGKGGSAGTAPDEGTAPDKGSGEGYRRGFGLRPKSFGPDGEGLGGFGPYEDGGGDALGAFDGERGSIRPVSLGRTRRTRNKRAPKVGGIILVVLVIAVALAYTGVSFYFADHFFPHTTIGTADVSLKSTAEAKQMIHSLTDGKKLLIEGEGATHEVTAVDLSAIVDAEATVEKAHAGVNALLWPFELGKSHDLVRDLVSERKQAEIGAAVQAVIDELNAEAVQPSDAAVVYSPDEQVFVVQPETVGTALDAAAVTKKALAAIESFGFQVVLSEDDLLQPAITTADSRLAAAAESANTMIAADIVLLMAGSPVEEVNADLISQWVTFDGDMNAALDSEALVAWVDEVAKAYTTVGQERAYTRADGRELRVSGGIYGWEVDQEALMSLVDESVASGEAVEEEIPFTVRGDVAAKRGERDWGNRYCDIDLTEQRARFYDDGGRLVWESDIITGIPDGEHDTPEGVYWMNRKASPSVLKGYEGDVNTYNTPVEYWMPFVGDAIGLHDAEWQPAFGGRLFREGAGSHGCVNLPPAKAKELYALIREADVVVCHW